MVAAVEPTGSAVDSQLYTAAVLRLESFWDAAARLPAASVRQLCGARGRAPRHARLTTDPAFLQSVAEGRWTSVHDELLLDIRDRSRRVAAGLVSVGRRHRVARALEDAALVVVAEVAPAEPSLPDGLRARLALPWESATGQHPGDGARLAS